MATKQENEKKKSLARALFLSGMEMTEIADKVDVSRVTISKWCAADGWKEARAAKSITRPELVNKLLMTIDKLIEQVNASDDITATAGLADKLSKLSAVISCEGSLRLCARIFLFCVLCHRCCRVKVDRKSTRLNSSHLA